MATKQPGSGSKDTSNANKDSSDDVEALFSELRSSLKRVLGGAGGKQGHRGRHDPIHGRLLLLVLLIVSAWLLFDSIALLDERERGVVLRFGSFDRPVFPGLSFKWPSPIEKVKKVNVAEVRSFTGQVRLLSSGGGILQIDFEVDYSISHPKEYLFGSSDPEAILRNLAESVIGDALGNDAMGGNPVGERAAFEARALLQRGLEVYGTGLQVSEVRIRNAQPQRRARMAFDDAIGARGDKARFESDADRGRGQQ
jgi:membrane protease subunit HflK